MTLSEPLKWTVDRVLKSSAVIACVAAVSSIGYAALTVHRARAQAEASQGGYRPGEKFNHPELLSREAPFALVIWLDPRCGACLASADFYRQLATRELTNVQLTVAAPQPRARLDTFLLEQAIQVKSVYALDGDATLRRLGPVPALVLVDRDAVVRKRWIGRLTPRQESEVLEALAPSDR